MAGHSLKDAKTVQCAVFNKLPKPNATVTANVASFDAGVSAASATLPFMSASDTIVINGVTYFVTPA
jgi:hypothetical protein